MRVEDSGFEISRARHPKSPCLQPLLHQVLSMVGGWRGAAGFGLRGLRLLGFRAQVFGGLGFRFGGCGFFEAFVSSLRLLAHLAMKPVKERVGRHRVQLRCLAKMRVESDSHTRLMLQSTKGR